MYLNWCVYTVYTQLIHSTHSKRRERIDCYVDAAVLNNNCNYGWINGKNIMLVSVSE